MLIKHIIMISIITVAIISGAIVAIVGGAITISGASVVIHHFVDEGPVGHKFQ
ncbi:MAG: hypothetical protein ACK5P5_09610 [Pseudobdellovibrionaceae bacterium]